MVPAGVLQAVEEVFSEAAALDAGIPLCLAADFGISLDAARGGASGLFLAPACRDSGVWAGREGSCGEEMRVAAGILEGCSNGEKEDFWVLVN